MLVLINHNKQRRAGCFLFEKAGVFAFYLITLSTACTGSTGISEDYGCSFTCKGFPKNIQKFNSAPLDQLQNNDLSDF